MQFNEAFEEYMSLYTEARFTLFPKGKSTNPNAILGKEEQGEKVKDGKAQGPDSKEEKSEDAEGELNPHFKRHDDRQHELRMAKAKAGVDDSPDFMKNDKVEDCETCGCSDEEVEDCETCGCEEKPEYGHLDDKFSEYIDQYESEDAERVDKDRMK